MAQIREIAEKKMNDLNANDLEGACRMLVGLRPVHGPRGGGVSTWHMRQSA